VTTVDRARLNRAMRELADGDRGSFDVVFAGVMPIVRKVATAMLQSPADADDAVQRAMEKLFAKSHAFEPDGDVIRWAVELTAWEARTLRKRASRERARTGEAPADLRDSGPNPEDQAAHAEALAALELLLGQVTDDDRQALFAEGTGDPTIRKRKQRATARLRALWRKYYGI
jgi:RNA polymerase sigma factor (sigma-70 family)